MKLAELKAIIDKAVENAAGCDVGVEVWFKKSVYQIRTVGQYGVIPYVYIEIGKKEYDGALSDEDL